jgi:hypothetical protein
MGWAGGSEGGFDLTIWSAGSPAQDASLLALLKADPVVSSVTSCSS